MLQNKEIIKTNKISIICFIVAVLTCVLFLILEYIDTKKLSVVWIILLIANIITLIANILNGVKKK